MLRSYSENWFIDLSDSNEKTLLEQWKHRLENHKLFAVLAIVGGVIGVLTPFTGPIKSALGLFSDDHKILKSDILLSASWLSGFVEESQTINEGKQLEGQIAPSSPLKLVLQSQSKLSASDIVVSLEGNAKTFAKPSDYFQGGEDAAERPYFLNTLWKGKPGVTLIALPKNAASPEVARRMTTLDLGRFSWNRNFGICFLKIVVTAKEMSGQAEFKVALKLTG